MKRTLMLRREALTDITLDDLGEIVGGRYSNDGITCPATRCVSREISCSTCLSTPVGGSC